VKIELSTRPLGLEALHRRAIGVDFSAGTPPYSDGDVRLLGRAGNQIRTIAAQGVGDVEAAVATIYGGAASAEIHSDAARERTAPPSRAAHDERAFGGRGVELHARPAKVALIHQHAWARDLETAGAGPVVGRHEAESVDAGDTVVGVDAFRDHKIVHRSTEH